MTKKADDLLRTMLRAAGLRATAPRVAALRRLTRATGPVSHSQVTESLAVEGWDRATVYRNLIDLTEAKLLRRTDLGDHVWRFELASGPNANKAHDRGHPHFVCEDCGTVTCLKDEEVQVQVGRTAPRALRKNQFDLQFRGRCDQCA